MEIKHVFPQNANHVIRIIKIRGFLTMDKKKPVIRWNSYTLNISLEGEGRKIAGSVHHTSLIFQMWLRVSAGDTYSKGK